MCRYNTLSQFCNSSITNPIENIFLYVTSLVQDYFLETLEERDYFGREATFYGSIRDYVEGFLNSRARHFSALIRQRPLTGFSSNYGR